LVSATMVRTIGSSVPDPFDPGSKVIWKADYYLDDYQHVQYTYDPCPGNTHNPNDFRIGYTYSGAFLTSAVYPTVKQPDGTSQACTVTYTQDATYPGKIASIVSQLSKRVDFHYGTTGEQKGRLIKINVD